METIVLVVAATAIVFAAVMLLRLRLMMPHDYLVVFSVTGKIWSPWAGYSTEKRATKVCDKLNKQMGIAYKVVSIAESVVFTLDEIEKYVYVCESEHEAAVLKRNMTYSYEIKLGNYKGLDEAMWLSKNGFPMDEAKTFPDITP